MVMVVLIGIVIAVPASSWVVVGCLILLLHYICSCRKHPQLFPADEVVKVTNTGSRDADDVVLGFLTPPSAGKDGVPVKVLFGFQRVHVKAGASATVTLYPSLMDFTRVALDGQFSVHSGEYGVHFGVVESHAFGMGYVEGAPISATQSSIKYYV